MLRHEIKRGYYHLEMQSPKTFLPWLASLPVARNLMSQLQQSRDGTEDGDEKEWAKIQEEGEEERKN
jgi:hypothetical protein